MKYLWFPSIQSILVNPVKNAHLNFIIQHFETKWSILTSYWIQIYLNIKCYISGQNHCRIKTGNFPKLNDYKHTVFQSDVCHSKFINNMNKVVYKMYFWRKVVTVVKNVNTVIPGKGVTSEPVAIRMFFVSITWVLPSAFAAVTWFLPVIFPYPFTWTTFIKQCL